MNIRKTGKRTELDAQWQILLSLLLLTGFGTYSDGNIGDGGTAGRLRTNATVAHRIAGVEYSKASTDDLWNLSAETDTAAGEYRAYWLHLDASGTASFAAGEEASTAALALKVLPTPASTKSIAGVFVAGPETDFDDAGGLAAQGTIYDGIPAGVPIGLPGYTYIVPAHHALVGA